MNKYAVFGELLYLLVKYEKGNINLKFLWGRRYTNHIKQSVEIMKLMIILLSESNNFSTDEILNLVDYLNRNEDGIFILNEQVLEKCKIENFVLFSDVSLENKYASINKLMLDIVNEILLLIEKRGKKYKLKIAYLLLALHNLPKVYLNPNTKTLCNIDTQPISMEDALEYAYSYLEQKANYL